MPSESFVTDDGRTCRVLDGRVRKGGQAVVYQAVLDGRPVAVKVYQSGFGRALTERRLLEEIQRADPTAGEWLVTVLDGGHVGDRPFLVLPWMDTTLTDWIPGRPLGTRVAALLDVTRAVGRLHSGRGCGYRVHRDIKPDNVLVNWEGRWVARLADLGAAKGGETRADTTNTGVRTERFAPPEQALPVNQEPRESWDVHALAVTVFWGLTERIPIPALDAASLLNAEGRELVRLTQRGLHSTMNAEERARHERLCARRPAELLDLDGAEGWREDDTSHLRRALEDAGVEDEVRERLVSVLVPALQGALEPDGERRDRDVGRLVSALGIWAEALPAVQERGGTPTRPERSAVLAESDAPSVSSLARGLPAEAVARASSQPSPAPPVRARWWLPVGGIGVFVVGVFMVARTPGLANVAGGGVSAAANESTSPAVVTPPPTPAQPTSNPAPAPAAPPKPTPQAAEKRPSVTIRPAAGPITPASPRAFVPEAPVDDAPAPVVPAPSASPVPVDAAAVAAPAAPATVPVRVRACPQEGATVSVDGAAAVSIGALALKLDLAPGPHTFAWAFGGQTDASEVTITTARGMCHAFTVDRACGRCED